MFGHAPVRPRFHPFSEIVGMTEWWREGLDEETLRCYFGTSEEFPPPGYISRMETLIIGNLGPDLPFALDYRGSPAEPDVVFLGEQGSWLTISDTVCGLILGLDPQRAGC
ncbi:hypothetical protein [Streptomyces sp. NPDC086838]|uniref:hypothetical protein n=1 Tax=Streptomyces sp. NPDC086838 TaxID=3365762 RepID=UPI0038091FFF